MGPTVLKPESALHKEIVMYIIQHFNIGIIFDHIIKLIYTSLNLVQERTDKQIPKKTNWGPKLTTVNEHL